MADGEHWKERLGFVSGTIVVWALAVMNLWPTVATFQTGQNLHFWTLTLPGDDPRPGLYAFWVLTLLLALGGCSLLLSVTHMFARGLWLGTEPGPGGNAMLHAVAGALDRVATFSYKTLLIQWLVVLTFLPLLAVGLGSAMLEAILRIMFVSTSPWLRFVAGVPFFVLLFVPGYIAFCRFLNITHRSPDGLNMLVRIWRPVLSSIAVVTLAWLLVIETCFTVDLTLNKSAIMKSRDDYVAATVRLGGAASDARYALLELVSGDGALARPITMQPMDGGWYAAHIPTRDLDEDVYRMVLRYPRASFDLSYPYLHFGTARTRSFVVLP